MSEIHAPLGQLDKFPTVDIIVPTNRVSRFLPDTLSSVHAQTYPHWRMTIVDDGSPDPARLDALAAEFPKTKVVHQVASGTSAARNRGIRMTEAPLIVFLDDDDLWVPDRLERQVKAWQRAPEHVGVFSGGSYIDAENQAFGTPWPAEQTLSRVFLAGEAPLPRIVTMMVRRDVCDLVNGFCEGMGTGQDLDFTLRVLQRGEMLAVPGPLTRYRRHDTNVSQAGSLAGRRAIQKMLDRQIGQAQERGDASAALLLGEYRRRARAGGAREAIRGGAAAIRHKDIRTLGAEVAWAVRTPRSTMLALWAASIEKMKR